MKKKLFVLGVIFTAILLIGSSIIPAYAENDEAGEVNARAFMLMDFNSGAEVCSDNAIARYPIASMVKIMTLNLIFERIDCGELSLDDEISISETASSMGGSQAFLDPHCMYKVEDLVKSIIVASANDSCVAMAEHLSGSIDAFVFKMNEKAKEWGMENTNFVNCTGLPSPNGYSCANDVAIMSRKLMCNPKFLEYAGIWTYDLVHPSGRVTTLTNTNKLSRFYDGCDGGKTGYTNEALSCLSATAKRGNTRLLCVVIGAPSSKIRNAEVTKLLNYGFANFENRSIVKAGEIENGIPVIGGKQQTVRGSVSKDLSSFCNKRAEEFKLEIRYEYFEVKAPVKIDDVIGKVVVVLQNGEELCSEIVSLDDVEALSYYDCVKNLIKSW